VVVQVGDGLPEPGVGLHEEVLDLAVHPGVGRLDPWTALLLVQEQTRLWRKPVLLGLLVGTKHRAQGLRHAGDLLGNGLVDLDEFAPTMGVI
jgi:hypothetical protein